MSTQTVGWTLIVAKFNEEPYPGTSFGMWGNKKYKADKRKKNGKKMEKRHLSLLGLPIPELRCSPANTYIVAHSISILNRLP